MQSGRLAFVATVVAGLAQLGCATQDATPFHVYQSPLLAAETPTPRPSDRSFDPAHLGDYPEGEQVVADSRSADWEKPAPAKGAAAAKAVAKDARPRRKPVLSIGLGGRDGAASSSNEAGDFAPALAAEYAFRTFAINGASLPQTALHSIPNLWEACRSAGRTKQSEPLPGDAVFFHNAFDANTDGRNNDWYTHVGIVEAVDSHGTVTVMSYIGAHVVRTWANPSHPDEVGDDVDPVNSRLRIPTADDAPFTQYHAGQLFAGYCSVPGEKTQVVLMDDWQPQR